MGKCKYTNEENDADDVHVDCTLAVLAVLVGHITRTGGVEIQFTSNETKL